MIYFTSDYHFNHNKDFIYKARGFNSIEEMNAAIVRTHNLVVNENDDIYILGDLALGENNIYTNPAFKMIAELKGKIHLIRGNHDTDEKIKLYESMPNIVEIVDAKYLRCGKYTLFLSHFPCLISGDHINHKGFINLFGHTHQQTSRFENKTDMYHVGVDSNACCPISLEAILLNMKKWR